MSDERTGQLSATEVARLDAMGRLALGAAHTMNNAFTTAMGEAGFLLEDRKDDPVVVEAAQTIQAELERCARITRALLARRSASRSSADGVDLVRVVGELSLLLDETLGRQTQLELELPETLLPVGVDAASAELLVVAVVHYASDHAGGNARIRLALEHEEAENAAAIRLETTAAELPEHTVTAFLDPEEAPDAVTASSLAAVEEILTIAGGARHAARTGPDSWAALLHLPIVD